MKSETATCERTGNKLPLAEGFFVATPGTGEWVFICKDAPEHHSDYSVLVGDLVKSPESLIDWMAHLNEKTWFNSKKFFDFFTRLRKENNLYQ